MSRKGGDTMHPKSLKNLTPWTREEAQKGQKASVEARMRNKAAREALRISLNDWKVMKDELKGEAPSALDVLRIHMMKAIAANDGDEATRLATVLAEFEAPKLQRQDITQVTKTSDMSDEELAAAVKEMGLDAEEIKLQ